MTTPSATPAPAASLDLTDGVHVRFIDWTQGEIVGQLIGRSTSERSEGDAETIYSIDSPEGVRFIPRSRITANVEAPEADLFECERCEADVLVVEVVSFTGFAGGDSHLITLACGHNVMDDSADVEAAR